MIICYIYYGAAQFFHSTLCLVDSSIVIMQTVEFVHLNSYRENLVHASSCTCAGMVILSSRGFQAGVMALPGAFGNAGELCFQHNIFVLQGSIHSTRLGDLNNRNLFSYDSGDYKSKIKVLAGLVFVCLFVFRPFSLAYIWSFSPCVFIQSSFCNMSVSKFSHKDTSYTGLESTLMISF